MNTTDDIIKVIGGDIMLIGDLHFSDVFNGKHINYLVNCYETLGKIDKEVERTQPKAIIIAGDIVGWDESNIRSREVLSHFCRWFINLSDGGKRRIICIRGNHDTKGYPEFQFMSDLGLFETASSCNGFFDYYGTENQDKPEIRFHLVDYGQESRDLNIAGDGTSNIVVAHNNFIIKGYTNWYMEKDGIELCMQPNFTGVDMVISGHIHTPSPEVYATEMMGGGTCMLFYLGCPTRPVKEQGYEKCWFMHFSYDRDTDATDYRAVDFDLKPLSEVFYSDDEFIEEKTEEEFQEELRSEALKEVIGDILKYRMSSGDLFKTIDSIPNATEASKELAKQYLTFALNAKQS